MVNISNLNNQTAIDFNTTIIENSSNIISNIINTANTQSDNYYGLIVMTLLYVFFQYQLQKENGLFRLDFTRAGVYASGSTLLIGITLIVSGIITNYQHVIWYGTIFTIFIILAYFKKNEGG